jgi:hypothetical protein
MPGAKPSRAPVLEWRPADDERTIRDSLKSPMIRVAKNAVSGDTAYNNPSAIVGRVPSPGVPGSWSLCTHSL